MCKLKTKMVLLVLLVLVAACAGPSIKVTNITDISVKENVAGFSFLPPQDFGWKKVEFSQNWINYGRKSATEIDHTYSAWAKLIRLSGKIDNGKKLLTITKSQRDQDNDPARFKVRLNSDEIDSSRKELCVRYHWIAEDSGAEKESQAEFLVIDAYGLICLHPYDQSLLIDFHYSERYKQGSDVADLSRSAGSFFKHVKFEGDLKNSQGIAVLDADLWVEDNPLKMGCLYSVLLEQDGQQWAIKDISKTRLVRSSSKQEILCVNETVDTVAPGWDYLAGSIHTGQRGDCTLTDSLDHVVKGDMYNECNSVFASTSVGRSILLNTLGFLSSGAVGYSRVTDKRLIRKIAEEISLVKQVTEYKNKQDLNEGRAE